eukprot:UN16287
MQLQIAFSSSSSCIGPNSLHFLVSLLFRVLEFVFHLDFRFFFPWDFYFVQQPNVLTKLILLVQVGGGLIGFFLLDRRRFWKETTQLFSIWSYAFGRAYLIRP